MSLYIQDENQKIIWESMNKVPKFQTFHGNREQWFREIIEQFYSHNKFKLISMQELRQLNRDTVTYMIKDLNARDVVQPSHVPFMGFSGPVPTPVSHGEIVKFPSSTLEGKVATRDFMLEQKQEELNKQFSTRQQEYGEMLNRGPTQDVDFRATASEDKPIENMDELIQQHMKQREYEIMNTFGSTPVVQHNDGLQLDEVNLGTLEPNTGGSVFRSASSESQIPNKPIVRSAKFPYNDITNEPPPKNVKWSSHLEESSGQQLKSALRGTNRKIEPTTNDSNIVREFMENMTGYMQTIRDEIESLKQGRTQSFDANQNPVVNNILSRMKHKHMNMSTDIMQNTIPSTLGDLEDISNTFVL
jgi:hypothetical protein